MTTTNNFIKGKSVMIKMLLLSVIVFILLISCSSTRMKSSTDGTGKDELSSASFTTIDGAVIYTFSKTELDTLKEILKSSNNEQLNPVANPVWNNYLRLTFAMEKIEIYSIYDQFIVQVKESSPKKLLFTQNEFWLYDKAARVLGEVSKEYQKVPRRK